ncbi:putative thiamine transporter SLC35F3 [Asterias rubens]|uniref:putative thiamine transporter SLC35F3 n=1 Tax=Asterias rubens TaxID=7604 RepID=UPI001455B71F|nr:putative thiamine transporter SLC35F3 [Asterias rubens]XP_033640773.1 putative thiamine transporter SLC35F3 [Asterias rubens]XP_033640774.1 putative thiamine transporter SLC35F3 [Asterias rubens]XP_033640775.1 putative thiamine transporter SLC35F3 [Asterias rubens]XP_033640776.1 putative thiamine transporter SLC35F3 [Asterias rubens]
MESTAVNGKQENEMLEDNTESKVQLSNGKVEITMQPKEKKPGDDGCLSDNAKKVIYGLLLVIGIALSWVSATQFAKSTYSATFNAPFFVIWFSTVWMMVCYPVYVVGSFILFKEKRKAGIRSLFREDQKIYGDSGLTILTYFKYIGPFTICWEATNYMYIRALGSIHVTDATALFTTNTAFVYICSWIWLKEKYILIPARSFSVLMCIMGTVLMCYSDGFGGGRAEGVVLALGAALGAALYKVLFFRVVGKATYGQVSLFLSLLGVFNLVFFCPIMVTLYFTGVEKIDWGNLPGAFLCGKAALGLVFNFLVNFGIAVTFPLFIALGTVIGIPLNGVVDSLFRDTQFGWVKILGAAFIMVAFFIMLVPEPLQRKVACWKEGQCPCERQTLDREKEGVDSDAGEKREGENWMRLKQDDNEENVQV